MSENGKTIHTCTACGFQTPFTTSMKRHILRVKPCKPVLDPDYLEMKQKYIDTKKPEFPTKKRTCKKCMVELSCSQALSRHKKTCKGLPQQVLDQLTAMNIRIEAVEQVAQTPNVTNVYNITQNNNQINNIFVDMAAFGKEKIDKILANKQFLDQCVRRRDKGVDEFVQQIHDVKQHKNIRNAANRPNHFETFNGRVWVYESKEEVAEQEMNRAYDALSNHYKKHANDVPDHVRRSVKDFMYLWGRRDFDTMVALRRRIVSGLELIQDSNIQPLTGVVNLTGSVAVAPD
jgi:hypothetical protein